MTEDNKLAVPISNKLSINTTPRGTMASRLQAAKQQGSLASESLLDFKSYPNRIIIAVDDSGSMSSRMNNKCNCNATELGEDEYNTIRSHEPTCNTQVGGTRMSMAKEACTGFLNVCSPSDTGLGMYTISTGVERSLNWNYTPVTDTIKELHSSGGTPTFDILQQIINKENVTRVVLISDGRSNSGVQDGVLTQYIAKKIIIDAVFIGTKEDTIGIAEMQTIAEKTGGMFLHFTDAKDFASKFKYLAPMYYAMLTSGEIKV